MSCPAACASAPISYRTLVYEPEVILMDEPFGPLDAQTRLLLQNQLLELWHEERKTIVFITHDLGEAIALADRVVVMSARPGRIKTIAPVPIPRPRNLFEIHARRSVSRGLSGDVGEPRRRSQERSRAMASSDLTRETPLPPGAANVEDDVKAFEAEERRGKIKLMAARIVLAIVILAVWEYGTDRWFDALWFSSPLRVARHSGSGCRTISSRIW